VMRKTILLRSFALHLPLFILLSMGVSLCADQLPKTGYMEVWPLVLTKHVYQLRIPAVKSQDMFVMLDVKITPKDNGLIRKVFAVAKWQEVNWPQDVWKNTGLPANTQVKGAWIAEVPIAQDRPGKYSITAGIIFPNTLNKLRFLADDVTLHAKPDWMKSRAGIPGLNVLPKSWTPMSIRRKNDKLELDCWNRLTELSSRGGFIDQIINGKENLLTAPMQMIISDADGKRLEPAGTWQVMKKSTAGMVIRREYNNKSGKAQITLTQEYDGFTWINIDFKGSRGIGTLEVRVPLQSKLAKYIYYYPDNPWYWGNIKNVIPVPREGLGWTASYRDYLFIGDVSGGLYWYSGDRKQWQKPDDADSVQVLSNAKSVEARFLVHTNPELIDHASYEFGMQTTPVKPWPQDPLHNRISLFNWDEGIVNSLDRLKEVGYKAVGLCEWWTTAWGGTVPRDPKALKHLTEEAHKRGMQVILYFGFEIDETQEDFKKFPWELIGADPRVASVNSGKAVSRFYPPERFDENLPDRKVYGSLRSGPEKERLLAGMKTLLTEYGVDGFYLDGTQLPTDSLHEARDLMKRMRYLVDTYATRGIIYAHTSSRNDIAVNSFADVVSNGEQLAAVPELSGWKDDVGSIPMDYVMMMLNAQPWGVPHDIVDVLGPEYSDLASLLGTGSSNYQWGEDQWPARRIWVESDLWHASFTPCNIASSRWDKRPANIYVSYYLGNNGLYTMIVYNANLATQEVSVPIRTVLNLAASQKMGEPSVAFSRAAVKWISEEDMWKGDIPACRGVILQAKVLQ